MTCDNGDEDSDADERELAPLLCARTVLSVPISPHGLPEHCLAHNGHLIHFR